MSDIKRFNVKVLLENPGPYEVWFEAEPDGAWITVADHKAEIQALRVDAERRADIIIAMAEDGWLLHGEEGMDDTQKLLETEVVLIKAAIDQAKEGV